jgi:hypothetical protein
MAKKRKSVKADKSKKTVRSEKQPPKQEASKWQEFLRRHNTVKEIKD